MPRNKTFSAILLTLFLLIPVMTIATSHGDVGIVPTSGDQCAEGLAGAACRAKETAGKSGFNTAEGQTLTSVLGLIVQSLLTLLGVIFLILTIYGGYIWMMAGGNEEETKKAKSTITNAAIGLLVVLGSYVLYAFIAGILGIA